MKKRAVDMLWLFMTAGFFTLLVGLAGCTDEKPTAKVEGDQLEKQVLSCSSSPKLTMSISQRDLEARRGKEDISFCDAIEVLNANRIDFEDCRVTYEGTSIRPEDLPDNRYDRYDYGCVTRKAKEVLALQAKQMGLELVFGSDPGLGPSENQWVIPGPNAKYALSIAENYESSQRHEDMNSAIEAELESLGLTEKQRPKTWEEYLAQFPESEKPYVTKYLRERWDNPPVCELTLVN